MLKLGFRTGMWLFFYFFLDSLRIQNIILFIGRPTYNSIKKFINCLCDVMFYHQVQVSIQYYRCHDSA